MPKGEPNRQTVATDKYQKKAGYMTKGFKLKRELVEEFEEVCKATGQSQASVISEFMKAYIANNSRDSKRPE